MPVRLLVSLVLLCVSYTAHAEEITPWSFKGQMPKEANAVQLTTAQIRAEGLYINTTTDGYIVWGNSPLDGPAEVVTIRAMAPRQTKAALLWKAENVPEGQLVQLPFDIPASAGMRDVNVIVVGYPQWDWQTEQFAIAFPEGTDVTIEEIQFRHWPFYERMIERWKSFWTFDTFRAYSINFLWGPLLAGNEPQRATLYDALPPSAPSITRAIYVILLIAGVCAFVIGRKPDQRSRMMGWFTVLCIAIWLAFTVRMDAEVISYAVHDLQTWTLKEPLSAKRLRNYEDVHATVLAMAPEIRQHESFAMLTPYREVYFQILRYFSYPSIILPEPETWSGATAWAVLDRDDVWVDDQNRLRLGKDPATAQILTPPGHVAVPVKQSSFLFVVP